MAGLNQRQGAIARREGGQVSPDFGLVEQLIQGGLIVEFSQRQSFDGDIAVVASGQYLANFSLLRLTQLNKGGKNAIIGILLFG